MRTRYIFVGLGLILLSVIAWQIYKLFIAVDESVGKLGESIGKKDVSLSDIPWEYGLAIIALLLLLIFMKVFGSNKY